MSCDCGGHGLLPLENAVSNIAESISSVLEVETVELTESLGRVLAEDIVSTINVPSANNSAMDGYAFCHADLASFDSLTVAGESFAGSPFIGSLERGQCIRIMTGAVVPTSVDTVIMQELVKRSDDAITLIKPPKLGANVRRAGEDIAKGGLVYSAGRVISAIDVGIIASIGLSQLKVLRRPKIGIFSTGDELKQPGELAGPGDIFDSNRYSVMSMLKKLPVEVVDYGCLPDDKSLIRNTVLEADEYCDALITSGGVSVGEADFTREILEELGSVNFWKLAIKPGKPFAFGQLKHSTFFGLPGNPVSATVTFHQLVVPALFKMASISNKSQRMIKVRAAESFDKKPGRTDFQRGILENSDGELSVKSAASQGSGILSSMAHANCYVVLERERGDVSIDEWVDVLEFDDLVR